MLSKLSIFILFVFFACKQNSETQNPIVGVWEFERIELLNGDQVDLSDSNFLALHRQHVGLTFSFTKDQSFKVTQQRPGQPEEFIAEQPYELPEDHKSLVLKNSDRPDDVFDIIGLSDSLLRINVFKSPMGYVVFRKRV